jgi:hypothetical protein
MHDPAWRLSMLPIMTSPGNYGSEIIVYKRENPLSKTEAGFR